MAKVGKLYSFWITKNNIRTNYKSKAISKVGNYVNFNINGKKIQTRKEYLTEVKR
tara:strand:- start:508 stop:672 length:165 start_codon:yes stop_codon:yes gene_type:complete